MSEPPQPDHKSVEAPRCPTCGKLLAEVVSTPARFVCPRCKTIVTVV